MTKFEFNPMDLESCKAATAVIQLFHGPVSLPARFSTEASAAAASAQISATPEDRQPVADTSAQTAPTEQAQAAAQTSPTGDDPNTPDKHGMVWDENLHSTPPKLNADGSWRAKQGQADALKAEIERRKAAAAQQQTTPAQTGQMQAAAAGGMPGMTAAAGMPGITGQDAPKPAPTYEEIVARFMEMSNAGKIPDAMALYTAAGITDPNSLLTEDTARAALAAELDKIG